MMEDIDSELILQAECITQMELTIALIAKTLDTILQNQKAECDLLMEKLLPSISNPPSNTSENPHHYPELLHENVSTLRSGAQHLTPASQTEFLGDCTKGRAFLNLCEPYINLVPHQFTDDHAKILWAFLFMKSDLAACFMDRQMHNYQEVGSLPYSTWSDFIQEFMDEFCPKNEILTA
jgi:hypothetical protein